MGVRAGGLAICIRRNIDYCILPSVDLPAGELLLIKINVKPDFVLRAAYVAPRAANFSFECFNKFFQLYPRVLIGGDFNAHHFDWGNPSCN